LPEEPPDPEAEARQALIRELGRKWQVALDHSLPGQDEQASFEEAVRRALARRVLEMMLNRPNRLMTALYVLDISEHAFREAMAGGSTPADQAYALAGVILDRELRRVLTRLRYQRRRERPPALPEHPGPEQQDSAG